LLRDQPIHFKLIGNGQAYPAVRKLANDLALKNIDFVPPISIEKLAAEIAGADICLGGHFGTSEKAMRVVPGKVYQILAASRSLIAGDTPANRALLTPGEEALFVRPDDPSGLAATILQLHRELEYRESLAQRGRARYEQECSEAVITASLQKLLAGQPEV
jgi:glycosyltransferase involved in cell wall biosynthesis